MCHPIGNSLVYPEVFTREGSRPRAVDRPNSLCSKELRYRNAFIAISISSSSEIVAIGRKTVVWLRTDHPDRYLIAR
ncbi:MAG: hypothetical protein JWP89_6105 [Schlesneria sp.]|nr:hypothetical protein [Schlesneria sp.]